jgi:hypothetical protein
LKSEYDEFSSLALKQILIDSVRKSHPTNLKQYSKYKHGEMLYKENNMTIQGNKLKHFSKLNQTGRSKSKARKRLAQSGDYSLEKLSLARNSIMNKLSKTLKGSYYGALPHENVYKNQFQSLKKYSLLKKLASSGQNNLKKYKFKSRYKKNPSGRKLNKSRKGGASAKRKQKLNNTADYTMLKQM